MYQPKVVELPYESIKITWCACERCLALGPRSMTLHRGGREKTFALQGECCGHPLFDQEGPEL